MIKGTTSIGFDFEIDERRCNDYRLISIVTKLAKDPENASLRADFFEALRTFVGTDIENALVDYVVNKEGWADADMIAENIGEIYKMARDAMDEIKRKNLISSATVSQKSGMNSSVTLRKPTGYTILNQSPANSQQPYAQDSGTIAE